MTTHELAKILGRRDMANALGVGLTAISKEVVGGSFPPGWFLVLRDMCDRRGVECPVHLFKFKTPSGSAEGPLACGDEHNPPRGENPPTTGSVTQIKAAP